MKSLADAARQEQMPVEEEQNPAQERLTEEEDMDVEIAENLGLKFMQTPEAQEALQGAVAEGGDPAAKLGAFFAQLIDKIQTKMDSTDTPLSPRIWLSQNGVFDSWMEDLSEMGLVPEELGPAAKTEVLNILKLQDQSVGKGPAPQQGPQGLAGAAMGGMV